MTKLHWTVSLCLTVALPLTAAAQKRVLVTGVSGADLTDLQGRRADPAHVAGGVAAPRIPDPGEASDRVKRPHGVDRWNGRHWHADRSTRPRVRHGGVRRRPEGHLHDLFREVRASAGPTA